MCDKLTKQKEKQIKHRNLKMDKSIDELIQEIELLKHKNQTLELKVDDLKSRTGLVWKEQPEHFIKKLAGGDVIYGQARFKLAGKRNNSKGKKVTVSLFNSTSSLEMRRLSDSYLYKPVFSSKSKNEEFQHQYLIHGNDVYEKVQHDLSVYIPKLVAKGEGFGFSDPNEDRKNVLIEGDNYHALQILQHTHASKVDVISIDPPYNTGNMDFKYNDTFIKDSEGNKHSSWLSFMNRRLQLAKNLLSDIGVIFIHIDNNEYEYLKLLCDKIFGENNKITEFHWKTRSTGGQVKDGAVIEQVEFCLMYAKNRDLAKVYGEFESKTDVRDLRKSGGQWQREYRPKQHYPIYVDVNDMTNISLESFDNSIEVLPVDSSGIEGFWAYGKETCRSAIEEKRIFAKKIKDQIKIQVIRNNEKHSSLGNYIDIPSTKGSSDIKALGITDFNSTPKPIELIKRLISTQKEARVFCDFFAGSGTLGEAVWSLNKEDGKSRQFILITNNEGNICEDITYKRLYRANMPEHGDYKEGLEYVKVEHINVNDIDGRADQHNIDFTKQIISLMHGSYHVIEENDNWFATKKCAVLTNWKKREDFFIKFKDYEHIALLSHRPRKFDDFSNLSLAKGYKHHQLHHFTKDYVEQMKKVLERQEILDQKNLQKILIEQ